MRATTISMDCDLGGWPGAFGHTLPQQEPGLSPATQLVEANHRLANSLQLVAALISVEARAIADPAANAVLLATRDRIGAIATVHRHLSVAADAGLGGDIDLDDYLADLVVALRDSHGDAGGRAILVEATPVRISAKKAVSIGIIVNELVSNACKYAYRPDEPGAVTVRLTTHGRGFRIAVEDHGRGVVPGARACGSGLGKRLIAATARSLDATFTYEDARPGTRFVLECPR